VLTDWIIKVLSPPHLSLGVEFSRSAQHSDPDVYRLPIDTEQIPYSFKDRRAVALLEGKRIKGRNAIN